MASNLPSQPYVAPKLPEPVSITDDVALGVNNALATTRLFADIAVQETNFKYKRMEMDIAQSERNFKHLGEFFDRIQARKNAKVAEEILLDEAARKAEKFKLDQAQARFDLKESKANSQYKTSKLKDDAITAEFARQKAKRETDRTNRFLAQEEADLVALEDALTWGNYGLDPNYKSTLDLATQQLLDPAHQESIKKQLGVGPDDPMPPISEGAMAVLHEVATESAGWQRLKTRKLDEQLSRFEHHKDSNNPELRSRYEELETEYRKSLTAPGSRGYKSFREADARAARASARMQEVQISEALNDPNRGAAWIIQNNPEWLADASDEQMEAILEGGKGGESAPILTLEKDIRDEAYKMRTEFQFKAGSPVTNYKAMKGHHGKLVALINANHNFPPVELDEKGNPKKGPVPAIIPDGDKTQIHPKTGERVQVWKVNPDVSGAAANDIAIVFSFMKALDPNSVVRESEFEVAMQTLGVWDKTTQRVKKMVTGEFLTPEQRVNMAASASRAVSDARMNAELQVTDALFAINMMSRKGTQDSSILTSFILGNWEMEGDVSGGGASPNPHYNTDGREVDPVTGTVINRDAPSVGSSGDEAVYIPQ